MTHAVAIAFAVCLLLAISTCAQDTATSPRKVALGVKAGANLAMLSSSVNSQVRPIVGPAFGLTTRIQIKGNVHLRQEMFYSYQGQKENHLLPSGGGPSIGVTKTTLHYLNFPLLCEVGKRATFQLGAQMGLLMGGTEKGTMSSMPVNRAAHDFMKDVDFALVGGFGYYLNDTFNAGLRANWGMTNRVLHFYIGYTLKHN